MDDTNDIANPNPQPLSRPTDTMGVLKDILGGLLMGATGRTTPVSARALGMPQAAGMTPQELQALMLMPERQAKTQELQEFSANAPYRRELLNAQSELARAKTRDSKSKLINAMPLQAAKSIVDDYTKRFTGREAIFNGGNPEWEAQRDDAQVNADLAMARIREIAGIRPQVQKAQPEIGKGKPGQGNKKIQLHDSQGNSLGLVDDTPGNRKLAKSRGYVIGQ